MDLLAFAEDVVKSAIAAGAHEAEVLLQTRDVFSVEVRNGSIETLTQSSPKGLGLRVFVDKRMAFVSTTDFDTAVIADVVRTVVRLAKAAGRDRFNGLPEIASMSLPSLDLFDPAIASLSHEGKIEMVKQAEAAAFAHDTRITNSEGTGISTSFGTTVIANSSGILYSKSGTSCTVYCAPLAEQEGEKQIGYYWCSKRFLADLEHPNEIGVQAAIRALRKLGARKVCTQKAPVIFDSMVAHVLWGPVFLALDAEKVYRGLSFLRNMLGKRVASPIVTLIDDPLMPRGAASMPFDGEGVPARRKVVVENGILQMYFYDSRTARKYGGSPSGNAQRGFASLPSIGPANFYLQPSCIPPADIIRSVSNGFYVTDTIGHGINTVTGDFSLGASGMWIRNGELAFPVQEVTIAGNMLDMMQNVEQIADDARFVSPIVSPTFKISEMTVSGR